MGVKVNYHLTGKLLINLLSQLGFFKFDMLDSTSDWNTT